MESNQIKIETGKFGAKIPLCRENNYPFPEFNLNDSKSLPRNFFDAAKKVCFAVCKDTSKERCRGVFLDKHILYATDTHRIARCTTDFETDLSFIVPDDLLEFLFKDRKAFALRVREPFPNCEGFFNSLPKHSTYCTFEKSAVSSAMKVVQPFCEDPLKKMQCFEFGKVNAISVRVVLTRCTFIPNYKNENGLDLRLKLLGHLSEAQESGLYLL